MCRIHTCPFWFALAVVSVHPIYTGSSIKATMVWTVINVLLTVLTAETCKDGCCLFTQHALALFFVFYSLLIQLVERWCSNIQSFYFFCVMHICWNISTLYTFQIAVSLNKGIQCLWNPLLHTKSAVNGLVVDRFHFLGRMAVPGLKSETAETAESTDNNHSFLWL